MRRAHLGVLLVLLLGPACAAPAASAVEAVRQWEYTPCVMDGKPVGVSVQVTVAFLLSAPPRNHLVNRF
jgi:hypothetical protein